MLLMLALLFHSQHHWFTPIRCSRMSLHRFLSLGSPEANSPPPPPASASPTYACKHGLKQRWVGSLGLRGGPFRRQEGAGGSEALSAPICCQPPPPADAISGPRTHLVCQRSTCARRRMTSCLSSSWTTDSSC